MYPENTDWWACGVWCKEIYITQKKAQEHLRKQRRGLFFLHSVSTPRTGYMSVNAYSVVMLGAAWIIEARSLRKKKTHTQQNHHLNGFG